MTVNKILIEALKLVEKEYDEDLRLVRNYILPDSKDCVAIISLNSRYIDQSIISIIGEYIDCEMYELQEAIQAMYEESETDRYNFSEFVTYFPKITADMLSQPFYID